MTDHDAGPAPQPAPPAGKDRRVVWLLALIAVLVGVGVFWVIATPHEQCYIGEPTRVARLTAAMRGGGRPDGIEGTRHPIEKTGPDTYRGIPSEFRDGDHIAEEAAIECGWELGEPYRVSLFGG